MKQMHDKCNAIEVDHISKEFRTEYDKSRSLKEKVIFGSGVEIVD